MYINIEEEIINILRDGAKMRLDLVRDITNKIHDTPQGVYKSLSNLKQNKIITVAKNKVSLSLIYIDKQINNWLEIKKFYAINDNIAEVLKHDKSKISYNFNSLASTDLFWTHIYTLLAIHTHPREYRYMLIPHDYFLFALSETDTYWVKSNINTVNTARLIVPYALELDKIVVRERMKRESKLQYLFNKNPLNQKEHEYYNILGEYIFKAKMDEAIHKQIVNFIMRNNKKIPSDQKTKQDLLDLINQNGKYTLTIERNANKAARMKKKLNKFFE